MSVIDTLLEPTFDWPAVTSKYFTAMKLPIDATKSRKTVTPGKYGNIVTKSTVKRQPLYTIIMLDPDLPLPGQFIHLLRVNVGSPGKNGQLVLPYVQPLPLIPAIASPASPYHRYVVLVLAQKNALKADEVKTFIANRFLSFKLNDFIRTFNFESSPVAGNFFYGRLFVNRKVIC